MDKCCVLTALLLVYRVAFVDSQFSCKCEKDEGKCIKAMKNGIFRLEFQKDILADTERNSHYSCNVKTEKPNRTQSNKREITNTPSWSAGKPKRTQSNETEITCTISSSELPIIPGDDGSVTSDSAHSARGKKNGKDVEKRYTLSEIILVALSCLLLGALLTTLLMVHYMKRTRQGCFSKHVKDVQADSKQQSGPYLQFLTERVVVQKYDPKKTKSTNWKFENKAEETQYQSLKSNQVYNDEQTYDELERMEPRSDRHCKQPRDSDLGGHNYFILASDSISQESNARNVGRFEIHAEVGDDVKDTPLGTEAEQPDASHEYFVLEHVENGHNQD